MSDKKQQIVAALKEAGYNSSKVTVANRAGGYDWSFTLTIRHSSVNRKTVKDIGRSFQSVDRCEASGEVLAGGNTYVDIRLSDHVREAWTQPHLAAVEKALEELKTKEECYGVRVLDRFIFYKDNSCIKIWDDAPHIDTWLHYSYRGAKEISLELFTILQETEKEAVTQ